MANQNERAKGLPKMVAGECLRNAFYLCCFAIPLLSNVIVTADGIDAAESSPSLSQMTDAELLKLLDTADLPQSWAETTQLHREAVLQEMIRRANPEFPTVLRKKLWRDQRQAKVGQKRLDQLETASGSSKIRQEEYSRVERLSKQLDVLTALRRLENKPDPLTIEIKGDNKKFRGHTRELPKLKLALKNVDINDQEFSLMFGGNYRSGRHARWRIHVWDEDGNRLPVRKKRGAFMGGGMYSEGYFQPGQSWDIELSMRDYVDINEPGKYTFQILYHNQITIDDFDEAELKPLIISRSKRFELFIDQSPKTKIELTKNEFAEARRQTELLSDRDEVRVVLAPYGPDYHKYLKPDTAAGKLLTMRWKSVPAMIEAIQNPKMSFKKRGWILLLLFSITMERDFNPMIDDDQTYDILPSYRYKTPGGNGSMTRASDSGNVKAQLEFSKRWKDFAEHQLEVVVSR